MRKTRGFRQIFILSLLSFIFLFSAETAKACTCFTLPLDETVKEYSYVAILRLQAVEKNEGAQNAYGVGGIKQSKLSVEKVFK